MDSKDIPKTLQDKKEQLLEEQKKLIEILKTKHQELYMWFIENNVDLTDLKPFAASLSAALLLSLAKTSSYMESYQSVQPVQTKVIETDELQGLDEEERAKLVWERYGDVIKNVSQKYLLDPKLIFATIMVESNGNTFAIRHEPSIGDASYGLGQILYGTAYGLGFNESADRLFDPEVNIELIGRYHRRNLNVYGESLTPEQLTTAYNTGNPYAFALPGHIDKFRRWYNASGRVIL